MADTTKKNKKDIFGRIFGRSSECCCGIEVVPDEEPKQSKKPTARDDSSSDHD